MTEFSDNLESLDEIEALVRSARDYVHASDDLRPRVLESARSARGERRARRWIGQLAAVTLVLGLVVATVRRQPDVVASHAPAIPAARPFAESRWLVGYSDSNWEMVESFTELRRRQAELLRPAL